MKLKNSKKLLDYEKRATEWKLDSVNGRANP